MKKIPIQAQVSQGKSQQNIAYIAEVSMQYKEIKEQGTTPGGHAHGQLVPAAEHGSHSCTVSTSPGSSGDITMHHKQSGDSSSEPQHQSMSPGYLSHDYHLPSELTCNV